VAVLLGFLLLLCAASGGAARPGAASEVDPVVILLSFDGVRHDYLDRGGLPALERIARTGARARSLTPVFPSSTFPSHVALATGAPADRHGIVGNRFRDPERGDFDYSNDASFIEAEPIWVTAERQGVRSAAFFWVGSETDWNGTGASYRRAPFDAGVGEAEKVAQILAWLDLPAEERPRLILSWWQGADTAGHRFGPDSERTTGSLRGQDRQLARLLEGLDERRVWPYTTLLVVSDHGMIGVSQGIDAAAPLKKAGIRARTIPGGSHVLVYLEDPFQREQAVAALSAVDGVRAYPAQAVPATLRFRHPTRTGDVVALTDPPRTFVRPWSRSAGLLRISRVFRTTVGAHGYDPEAHPEMGGIFLAVGRGVPAAAVLPPVRAIDVAPTIAGLLGIDPPTHAEGSPIPGIGGDRGGGPDGGRGRFEDARLQRTKPGGIGRIPEISARAGGRGVMEAIGMNGLMVGAILLAGVALGFLLGRRTSAARARACQLEAELEDLRKEQERVQAEILAGRDELERTREDLEHYRGKVADHFAGTSERLRELTLQYRAIYNHLAEGAGELCPQGCEKLKGGLGLDALPEESEAAEPDRN
jgi:uncharacterized membrane-anchored protein YhcB (DUF1043 family)/arylsulfatase A-like enzyme